jgi:hypothetical protein
MRASLAIVGVFGLIVGLSTWFVVKLQRAELTSSQEALEAYKIDAGKRISEANARALEASSSGQGRLPESLHFAESDVILGAVRGEKCPQSQLWA